MRFPARRLLLLIMLLLAQAGAQRAAGAETGTHPPSASGLSSRLSLDDVLWWLPEDTETLMVAIDLPAPTQWLQQATTARPLLAASGLGGAKRGKFAEQLLKLQISRIVWGSREFRAPSGFGSTTFEGCTLVELQSPLSKNHMLLKWLAQNAVRTTTVAGYKTYVFDEKLEQDVWHFLIVQPRPNLLLSATSKSYLETVLTRSRRNKGARGKSRRALPSHLPEWKYVDTNSPEWGLRHYRKDQAQLDPTSPLRRSGLAMDFRDTHAVGITYEWKPKTHVLTARYLTAPPSVVHMTKVLTSLWSSLAADFGSEPPSVRARPGSLVTTDFSFTKGDPGNTTGMILFGLMGMLGHAVYV